MKVKNLIAMPFAVALDVSTIGLFEVTKNLRESDRCERFAEILIALSREEQPK